ncbi:MAG: glycosyltransferase [Desulfobacteraceae bacterium]|jgi:glycosyltransferase involved in cell wall biosynthesis|nr:glycosyltransferase [Desulfobacteraceae bacterium]
MKKKANNPIHNIGRGLPVWAQSAVRIPFLFFFAWETAGSWMFSRQPRQTSPCRTISIVIPTRNEEAYIERCIRSVGRNPYVREIIVVDAASEDLTQLLARRAGAWVLSHDLPIESGGGRGGQIKAGIQAASGDVIAVLHADTLLPGSEINRMMDVLNRRPDIIGGAVGCRFEDPEHRYRIIELANDLRAAFFKISFGDQVQFFRRVPIVSHQLFPGIPIMEDVEFSIRLHRLGHVTYLFGNTIASTRRWKRIGYLNAVWVIKNVFIYLIRRMIQTPDTAEIYQRYYSPFK